MSARKKWRLRLVPGFTYKGQPSMKRAYESVDLYRSLYAEGMSRTHHVDVEVDEGFGWTLYERIIFPERVSR